MEKKDGEIYVGKVDHLRGDVIDLLSKFVTSVGGSLYSVVFAV